jgi:hypothetical protein
MRPAANERGDPTQSMQQKALPDASVTTNSIPAVTSVA